MKGEVEKNLRTIFSARNGSFNGIGPVSRLRKISRKKSTKQEFMSKAPASGAEGASGGAEGVYECRRCLSEWEQRWGGGVVPNAHWRCPWLLPAATMVGKQ